MAAVPAGLPLWDAKRYGSLGPGRRTLVAPLQRQQTIRGSGGADCRCFLRYLEDVEAIINGGGRRYRVHALPDLASQSAAESRVEWNTGTPPARSFGRPSQTTEPKAGIAVRCRARPWITSFVEELEPPEAATRSALHGSANVWPLASLLSDWNDRQQIMTSTHTTATRR
jgi:hypothetical protein